MDRVGGYQGYLALYEDGRAYDDVLVVMHGEAQAERSRKRESERKRRR